MSNTRLEQLLKDASSGGFAALRELLRFLRKEKVRYRMHKAWGSSCSGGYYHDPPLNHGIHFAVAPLLLSSVLSCFVLPTGFVGWAEQSATHNTEPRSLCRRAIGDV